MRLPMQSWTRCIEVASADESQFENLELQQSLHNVLLSHVSVCQSLGGYFLPQMVNIFSTMLSVYTKYSTLINQKIHAAGPLGAQQSAIKSMRSIKKVTLKLMETLVETSENQEHLQVHTMVATLGLYHSHVCMANPCRHEHMFKQCTGRSAWFVRCDVHGACHRHLCLALAGDIFAVCAGFAGAHSEGLCRELARCQVRSYHCHPMSNFCHRSSQRLPAPWQSIEMLLGRMTSSCLACTLCSCTYLACKVVLRKDESAGMQGGRGAQHVCDDHQQAAQQHGCARGLHLCGHV